MKINSSMILIGAVLVCTVLGWLHAKWAAKHPRILEWRLHWFKGTVQSPEFERYRPPAELEEGKLPRKWLNRSVLAFDLVCMFLGGGILYWLMMPSHPRLYTLLIVLTYFTSSFSGNLIVPLITRFYGKNISISLPSN